MLILGYIRAAHSPNGLLPASPTRFGDYPPNRALLNPRAIKLFPPPKLTVRSSAMRWIVVSVSFLWLCPVATVQADPRPCCPPDAITGCAAHLWADYCQTQRRCHENLGLIGPRALLGAHCGLADCMTSCCPKPVGCNACDPCVECKIKTHFAKCASCLPKLHPLFHYRWRTKSDCCDAVAVNGDCCDTGCAEESKGDGEANDSDVDPPMPPGEEASFSEFSPPIPEA